ncbi:Hypothetical protein CINCED_3A021311 [Cinara cedri]|nr:Hypothetical protein CINCED_3A021311 [Cinara cedri]
MIIYGGYRDLKGSTNEMWAYHFDTESWHLLSQGRVLPPARHKHSAVIHDDVMWVYGGMTDLNERSDLWRFDFVKKKWNIIKMKVSPGPLHGHSASKVMGSMIIFGGKKGGQISNDLWKFYFGAETWEKVHTTYPQPPAICEAVSLTVSETTTTTTSSKSSRENGVQSPIVVRRSRGGRSVDRQYSSGSGSSDRNEHGIHQWQTHQSRPESRASSSGGSNVNILKEISKLSQLNLYRLAHNKTYSVLSSTDSVVSADASTQQQMQQNMVKSQSANVIARSLISPAVSNASPPGCKTSFPMCRMPRDPMSVPNFGVALTPVEATKLVYLEGEEAPSPRVEIDCNDFGSVHMRFQPNALTSLNKTINRRSYPMTSSASARFGNPYSTPEEPGEITSGYVSIETVHQSPNADGPISFSNPNYMVADIQNAISKGDYVKLNSPPDSLLEDDNGSSFEMREMNRPAPPKTLALNSSTAFNSSSSDVRSSTKMTRAASAGRAAAVSRPTTAVVEKRIKEYTVYLLGGTERDGSVTVFKKPMTVWKLSMYYRNVQ